MRLHIHADKSELAGKTLAEQEALDKDPTPWPISHVEILDDSPEIQLTQGRLDDGLSRGYMSIVKGRVIVHAKGSDVAFVIVRPPGAYCCHCGEKLEGGNQIAKDHIKVNHAGQSPDANNPAGYRVDNFYFCRRELN